MLRFAEAQLKRLAIHGIGNKSNDEGLTISDGEAPVDEAVSALLTSYFLKPFKEPEFYRFFHESDLNLNEVYTYVKSIFHDDAARFLQSVNIAKHL